MPTTAQTASAASASRGLRQQQRQHAGQGGDAQFGGGGPAGHRGGFGAVVGAGVVEAGHQPHRHKPRQGMGHQQGGDHRVVVIQAQIGEREVLGEEHQHQADGAVAADP